MAWLDTLQPQGVGPVVTEVVGVEQLVPGLDKYLIKPDGQFIDARQAVLDGRLGEVVLGEPIVRDVTFDKLVQMRIGPSHDGL